MWRTTNGGVSFQQQLSASKFTGFIKLSFQKNPGDTLYWGVAACLYDSAKLTTNSGASWVTINNFPGWGGDMRVKFSDRNIGYISTLEFPPVLWKTTNGGFNWSAIHLPYNANGTYEMRDFDVVSPGNIIYCVGGEHIANGNAGFVWKSTNGGANWLIQNLDTIRHTGRGRSIDFINENTGWVFLQTDTVCYKTTNGGGIAMPLSVSGINNEVPEKYYLSQNYPNPFNPSTIINYQLAVNSFVKLKVYNLLGKEVASLVNEKQLAGSYAVDFNTSEFSLPSGIYFYTLNAGEFTETRKMILVK